MHCCRNTVPIFPLFNSNILELGKEKVQRKIRLRFRDEFEEINHVVCGRERSKKSSFSTPPSSVFKLFVRIIRAVKK